MKIAIVILALCSLMGATVAQPVLADTLLNVEPVMITEKDSDRVYLSIGGWGPLSMDENGCLVIGEQSLMIWSVGTQASRTEDGRVQVIDGTTGKGSGGTRPIGGCGRLINVR